MISPPVQLSAVAARILCRPQAFRKRSAARPTSLCFTSPKEGWGITNLEAAACGTPVVASRSPGLRESVRDGATGFLTPHGDVAALAAAMRRLADDPALVARLGAEGRRFAETFTWERAAAETAAHVARHASQGG